MTNAPKIDIDRLAAILRDAALKEIMPRFRRLAPTDVRAKTSATDLVTEADEAAERFIMAECASTFPGAAFVGEELVAARPAALGEVGTADFVIVVDPIDGTANFAAGAPLFAVMAAVVSRGETVAGVIYDPMGDDVVMAEKGGGAVVRRSDGETVRLSVADPVGVADMVGAASHTYFEPEERRKVLSNFAGVKILANYRCAGHEHRLMATGHFHFTLYSKLMPWDHLAGALIVEEAGGYVRRFDGSRYEAGHVEGGLISATDPESWQKLRAQIFAGV